MELVVLVDELDSVIGSMEKMEAHQKGVLHRAFSIVLFNSRGQLLLQKRAIEKYHSGGLWTNTCCSHPLPDETMEQATKRKLFQEMGIETELTFAYKFIYQAPLDKALIEHECDYVFTGFFDDEPKLNALEAEDWKYMDINDLQNDIQKNPQLYTAWFKLIVEHPQFLSLTR
jgi:isopentenyl-diphosphate Delta-isomerase